MPAPSGVVAWPACALPRLPDPQHDRRRSAARNFRAERDHPEAGQEMPTPTAETDGVRHHHGEQADQDRALRLAETPAPLPPSRAPTCTLVQRRRHGHAMVPEAPGPTWAAAAMAKSGSAATQRERDERRDEGLPRAGLLAGVDAELRPRRAPPARPRPSAPLGDLRNGQRRREGLFPAGRSGRARRRSSPGRCSSSAAFRSQRRLLGEHARGSHAVSGIITISDIR